MPHDSSCGEWRENSWVADFVNEYNKKAQRIRIDRESEANHDLIRLLNKPDIEE
jgi:hypothetical protein